MKRSVALWQLLGFGVTGLGGTLLHYLYEWTNESLIFAPISGINESTWEHMKLLFFPMFIFAIFESRFFKDRRDFWCIKLKGMLLGLSLIPIIFYTYNGVIGKSPDWVNIAIFFISAFITFIYETKQFKRSEDKCLLNKAYFIILCIIAALFFIFTFFTPEIGIFKDPVSGTFGLQ